MKNNTLLLLSLLFCTQFAGAMEDRSGYGSSSSSEEDNNNYGFLSSNGKDRRKHHEMRHRGAFKRRFNPTLSLPLVTFNMPEAERALAMMNGAPAQDLYVHVPLAPLPVVQKPTAKKKLTFEQE
jgi:hypothetical protein